MTLPKHDPEKLDVTGPDRQTPKRTFGEPVHAPPRPPVLTPGPDLPKPPPPPGTDHPTEPVTGESPTRG